MAHILVAYKQFPAPAVGHAGGQSVYRFLQQLHRHGHRLTLVARIRDEEKVHLGAIAPVCDTLITVPHHRSLPGPRPWAILQSYLALRRATKAALREDNPDIFHIEFAQTAVALLGVKHPCSSFRAHDVNWFLMEQQTAQQKGLRRLRYALLKHFFHWAESWLYRRFDLIAAISEGDRQLLAPPCAPQPVLLLPLSPNVSTQTDCPAALEPGPTVLFVGAMSRAFNVQGVTWFLEQVWPSIVARVPEAKFYIVGSSPPDVIKAHHDGQHVFVTGFVEDLAAWYKAAAVFVSPMLVAGGLLQKVVDAMGMGIPVVATSMSNHGLCAAPGEHLFLADKADSFADAVVNLLQDSQKRAQLGTAGQQFVQTHYDPDISMDRWEMALRQFLNPPA